MSRGDPSAPRIVLVLVAFAALAAAACQPATDSDQAEPRPCPPAIESVSRAKTLDAQRLVGEKDGDAAQVARRYGCRLRVVTRDGRATDSESPASRVIDVEVRDGRVTRIIAVGGET